MIGLLNRKLEKPSLNWNKFKRCYLSHFKAFHVTRPFPVTRPFITTRPLTVTRPFIVTRPFPYRYITFAALCQIGLMFEMSNACKCCRHLKRKWKTTNWVVFKLCLVFPIWLANRLQLRFTCCNLTQRDGYKTPITRVKQKLLIWITPLMPRNTTQGQ